MKSSNFLAETSRIMGEFFTQEFKRLGLAGQPQWVNQMPSASDLSYQTSSGLFSRITGSNPKVFQLALSTSKLANQGNTRRVVEEKIEGDTKIFLSRKAPENYKIEYMIFGPSMGSELGQQIVSGLVTTLFDHQQVEAESSDGPEKLKLRQTSEPNETKAVRLLQENGIEVSPLFFYEVELAIASGTVIAEEQQVLRRDIRVNSNQASNGGRYS